MKVRRQIGKIIRCMGVNLAIMSSLNLMDLNIAEPLKQKIGFTASLFIFFIMEFFLFDD